MAKSTRIETEKRIYTVQGWLVDGVQDDLIIRQAITQWGVSLSQARRYFKKATDRWQRDQSITIEQRREMKIAELKQEIRGLKPEFKGTPAGMNAKARLHKMLIRLEDIEPAKRIQMEVRPLYEMTPEERDAKLAEYLEIIKKRSNGRD